MNSKNSIKFMLICTYNICTLLNFAFAQNNQIAFRGKVLNLRTEEPISSLVLIADNGLQEYKTLSNENGDFIFGNLPKGKYKIAVSSIYFVAKTLNLDLHKDTNINIYLEPTQRVLDEVYITASESKGMTSS